ncbi:MAG: hypothetical protein ACT4TC_10920 [Myxococcaceae bacterium]
MAPFASSASPVARTGQYEYRIKCGPILVLSSLLTKHGDPVNAGTPELDRLKPWSKKPRDFRQFRASSSLPFRKDLV